MQDRQDAAGRDRRLNGWKEIASFFNKDERTLKRWEMHRGLPVHRVPGKQRGTVYAFAGELDLWLKSARPDTADSEPDVPVTDAPEIAEEPPKTMRRQNRRLRFAGLIAGLAGVAALGLLSPATGIFGPGHPTSKPEAVELYLKGSYFWNKRTPADLDRAVSYFNRAIAVDPAYADAHMGLANCYNLLREYTMMPASEAYPKAKAAAERALALDESLADAHTALAFVTFYWSRDMRRAEQEFKRALQLDPNSARAHHWYGTALLHLGRFDQALAEVNEAQRLDPRSRAILADKGLILYYAGQTKEAVALLAQLAESEPDFLSPRAYLAAIHFAEKNYEGYVKEEMAAARLIGDTTRLTVAKSAGSALEQAGPQAMLAAILDAQQRLYAEGSEGAYALARTYALLGDQPKALAYLATANANHDQGMLGMRIDPALMSLRATADFQRLLADVGLPPFG
ncbi:MAG: tetratricopeptide repeat protein [Parvibaculaceae bacterium]